MFFARYERYGGKCSKMTCLYFSGDCFAAETMRLEKYRCYLIVAYTFSHFVPLLLPRWSRNLKSDAPLSNGPCQLARIDNDGEHCSKSEKVYVGLKWRCVITHYAKNLIPHRIYAINLHCFHGSWSFQEYILMKILWKRSFLSHRKHDTICAVALFAFADFHIKVGKFILIT